MSKQSVIGLLLDTHLRKGGSVCHWEFFAAKVLGRPWENLAKKVAEYYAGDVSPVRPRWRALPHIRNLAYAQVHWWRHASGSQVRAKRAAIRKLRGLLLTAGGKGWTSNFIARPRAVESVPAV